MLLQDISGSVESLNDTADLRESNEPFGVIEGCDVLFQDEQVVVVGRPRGIDRGVGRPLVSEKIAMRVEL